MSTHAVEQFYQKVIENPSLQERFKAATDEESVLALAVEMSREYELIFTTSDVKTWLAEQSNAAAIELQDADLDRVSGGNPLVYSPLIQLPPVVP